MAAGDRAVCRCSPGAPGGFGRPGKGPRPQAGRPGPELESMRRSQREPQPEPAGRCNSLWRDGSKLGEAGYCRTGEGRKEDATFK